MITVKTPGVYVEEVALFPPSVAEVATAIPAFIGYTEKAVNADGKALANQAVKISSLLEYTELFGGPYAVKTYTVKVDTANGNMITGSTPDKRFHLHSSLRQFFDNGGGECYIVSVGKYTDALSVTNFEKGLDEIKKHDEPTLLVFPDAVELVTGGNPDFDNVSNLHKKALAQCAGLQDRFAVLDLVQGNLKEDTTNKPISNFRDKVGINFLSYGAAYYPWIQTTYGVEVDFRKLKFVDAANAPIADISGFSSPGAEKSLVDALNDRSGDANAVTKDVGAVTITPVGAGPVVTVDISKLLATGPTVITEKLQAIENEMLPLTSTALKAKFTEYMNLLASVAQSFAKTAAAVAASSPVKPEIDALKASTKLQDALKALAAKEKNADVVANTTSSPAGANRNAAAVKTVYDALNGWYGAAFPDFDSVPADNVNYANTLAGSRATIADLKTTVVTPLLLAYETLLNAATFHEKLARQNLFSIHPLFKGVASSVTQTMQTIPPSGTVVGLYAMVDRTRGVWKAPANVSISGIVGPAVKIDNREQEDLNVHSTGKSINAIRAFTGKGTLIWGARTLAGNDNEWRYVPVRRLFIMVEESVKKASEPFVFEPNDANTWTKVRVMIENFLTLQWRAGALMGAKPEDAFFVHIGLGETMSADDVLNGKMIVEIGMAASRPAEFIILRFSHKMMER